MAEHENAASSSTRSRLPGAAAQGNLLRLSTFDREGVKVASTLLERRLDSARVRVDEQGLWMDEAIEHGDDERLAERLDDLEEAENKLELPRA
jgi:hypothetical protein